MAPWRLADSVEHLCNLFSSFLVGGSHLYH